MCYQPKRPLMESGSAYAKGSSVKGAFWPGLPEAAVVAGRTRQPLVGLVLTILTLGVYHFYFHLSAHGELLQQLGRRNREAPLVFAYLGLIVYGITLGWALLFLPLVVAIGVYAYLVLQQFQVLEEARERQGLPATGATGGPAMFFLWLVPGMLILVGPYVAYRRLIREYNEVWETYKEEAEPVSWGQYSRAPTQKPAPSMPAAVGNGANGGRTETPPGTTAASAAEGTNGFRTIESPANTRRPREAFSVKHR